MAGILTLACMKEFAVKKALALGMMLVAAAAGCSNTGKKTANSTVTEPLTPAPVAYTPAPQPYTPPPTSAQPVVYDNAPVSAAPAVSGSGNYTVKKGDTLFSIAKSRYGNGNQYTKIVAANPGLSPQTLKAGQSINIP